MEPRRSVSGGSSAKSPEHYAEKLSDPALGIDRLPPGCVASLVVPDGVDSVCADVCASAV